MTDPQRTSATDDDTPVNSPVEHPGTNIRQLFQQLEKLADRVDKIASPPAFRLADGMQLLAIIIGFAVAIFTATGFSNRMDDFRTRQSDTERRIDQRVADAERRLDARLDRIETKTDKLLEQGAKK